MSREVTYSESERVFDEACKEPERKERQATIDLLRRALDFVVNNQPIDENGWPECPTLKCGECGEPYRKPHKPNCEYVALKADISSAIAAMELQAQ